MKTWNNNLNEFKKNALNSLDNRVWLADTYKGIGTAFTIKDRKYSKLCYYCGQWWLLNKDDAFVSPYDIDTERLVKIIDEIHNEYTAEKKIN